MAADVLSRSGHRVTLFDQMGSVGRKFLLAGKGGLNLTHSEPRNQFNDRYADQQAWVSDWLADFDAQSVIDWAASLGIETFSGSSGRVFPVDLKAAPLLRRWVRQLRSSGLRFAVNHRWTGLHQSAGGCMALHFETAQGPMHTEVDCTVMALGGASWPILGSDGRWQSLLDSLGLGINALQPANCGFEVPWSKHFAERFAGHPIKPVAIRIGDVDEETRRGECVVTQHGIEGSLVYALSAGIRNRLRSQGPFSIQVDLLPDWSERAIASRLARPRRGRSMSEQLRRTLGLQGVRRGLVFECSTPIQRTDPAVLAARIKALPLKMTAPRPIAEAISSAGGVRRESLDDQLMSKSISGLFFAGEMLDWEAPTGGYLLTACLASGVRAGTAADRWLAKN